MSKKNLLLLFLTVPLLYVGQTAMAQSKPQDTLTYVLDVADKDVLNGSPVIAVRFQGSFPEEDAAKNTDFWRVIAIDKDGNTKTFKPIDVVLRPQNKLANLRMKESLDTDGELDPKMHKIIVRYQQQNLPTVTLGPRFKRKKKKTFTAAKGKKDADIYFNGSAPGQRGSGPVYSIEAKAGYLQSLKRAGAIGGSASFNSDAHSDIDPDSITASGRILRPKLGNSTCGQQRRRTHTAEIMSKRHQHRRHENTFRLSSVF